MSDVVPESVAKKIAPRIRAAVVRILEENKEALTRLANK